MAQFFTLTQIFEIMTWILVKIFRLFYAASADITGFWIMLSRIIDFWTMLSRIIDFWIILSGLANFSYFFFFCFQKPATTIRFFNRGEFYTVHGADAIFTAKEWFKTTSFIKTFSSGTRIQFLLLRPVEYLNGKFKIS